MKIKFKMKRTVRVLFAVLMLSTCFMCFSGITAFAAVDLDVTIVPPDDTVTNGSDCEVKLEILTKSDNGYKEMLINIEYDEDLLRLAAPVNQNGYRVVAHFELHRSYGYQFADAHRKQGGHSDSLHCVG